MRNLLVLVFICLCYNISAQHRVGVRAGLNYSKFNGPVEVNEEMTATNGFHFGINYTYEFNSSFGLRAELLYIQRGTSQKYLGFADYIVNPILPAQTNSFVEFGMVDHDLKISNAYLSIPFTAQYRINRKFEVFGGFSLDFLVGPTGRGKTKFISKEREETIQYTQSHDHNYGSDLAGQFNNIIQTNPLIEVDGTVITIPKIVGGYYNFTVAQREKGNRINAFDANVIGGLNYYINNGFYLGARAEIGLLDVTNDFVDYSLGELDDNGGYIFRDDKDTSFNISISFGFKF